MIINAAQSAPTLQKPQTATAKPAAQPAVNQSQSDSFTDQLGVSAENLDAAMPSINDSDTAMQSLQSARLGMQQQPNLAMQAQANLVPQTVLDLLAP